MKFGKRRKSFIGSATVFGQVDYYRENFKLNLSIGIAVSNKTGLRPVSRQQQDKLSSGLNFFPTILAAFFATFFADFFLPTFFCLLFGALF